MEKYNNKSVKDHYLKKARSIIYNKYSKNINNKYNSFIIHCILSNAKCHIVSLFKDFLLYDETSEFLKRFYKGKESCPRIKKISKFFKETSVLYPNYSPLIESKYIYSNIIKKQMVINKQENYRKKNHNKNNNIKKHHYYIKIEKEKKNEKQFFNKTIYNEILNEGESFMSLLFGIENKNNYKEKNNEKIINEDKDIDDILKIIDIIEKNEDRKKNINENILDIIVDENDTDNKDNSEIKSEIVKVLKGNNNNLIRNNNISNLKNSISSRIMFNIRYKKHNKKIMRIEKPNTINSSSNLNNNIYDASKENNNNINSLNVNQDLSNSKKIIYHKKMKTTLIGNYLTKLDLPSNSNVVNMLKLANETYAENLNKNSLRESLYKGIKYDKNEMKNSMNKLNNFTRTKLLGINLLSARNIKNSNSINSIFNKTETINSPENQNSIISEFNKIENSSKKIEIRRKNKNNYFGIKKKGLPLTTRNYTSIITFYNNFNRKKSNNDMSNGNIFNSITNNMIIPNNSFYYSSKKPENGLKSIYVNHNFIGPYSKPKCIDKEKKIIFPRKLFNKSNGI